jgi:uncharacterized protein (TIGR02453 family)
MMIFNGFSKNGINFLQELEVNNDKVWFESNKHLWEKEIKEKNVGFIEDMGETLQILVPNIKFAPKVSASLFKIYRDVRFSKDKTPMKSKIGLLFWQGSGHRMQSSSFYMHYSKDTYFIAAGIRNFKPELLKTYRQYIKNETKREELHTIIEDLKLRGYLIGTQKFVRIPKIFEGNEKHIYLSLYSAMFAYKEYKIDAIFYKATLLDRAFRVYEDMRHLQEWVYEMTLSNKTS